MRDDELRQMADVLFARAIGLLSLLPPERRAAAIRDWLDRLSQAAREP